MNLAYNSQQLILTVFHKEGLFIFVLSCLMFFALALIVAKWAYDEGQFSDLELSKLEVLED